MKSTTDHSSLGHVVLGVISLSLLAFIRAADCANCVPGWEWSYNSEGQNPCEIVGSLQAPCLGYSAYVLEPLSNDTYYASPQENDTAAKDCGCNTVIYSLYSACTLCQLNDSITTTTNNWGSWSQFCDSVYVSQYPSPVPFNTSVPHWAYSYLNDTTTFDPVLAKAVGRDPEATHTSPPTVSLSSTGSSRPANSGIVSVFSTRTSPNTSPTATGGSVGTKTNTSAIAGGVVGGVVVIVTLATLAFFFLKRRRKRSDPSAILGASKMGHNTTNDYKVYGPPKLYNPSDPSTFPIPLSTRGPSNSGMYRAGRYHGAAEL